MIAWMRGRIIELDAQRAVVDVGGLGYELTLTSAARAAAAGVGADVEWCTHLVVRDDAHLLFGFATQAERDLFRALIRVNGVGPRLAMSLLSALPVAELARAVAAEEVAALTRVPGVGRKTAERLVVELRDTLAGLAAAPAPAAAPRQRGVVADAEQALVALGYRLPEAARAVERAYEAGLGLEETVRRALRAVGER
jgi:Holliday junction DNA helicase RuvA